MSDQRLLHDEEETGYSVDKQTCAVVCRRKELFCVRHGCKNVLRDAKQLNCGCCMCDRCVSLVKKRARIEQRCDACKTKIEFDKVVPDYSVRKAVGRLKVKCSFVCKNLEDHKAHCEYRNIMCECGEFMKFHQQKKHQDECVVWKIVMCTNGCRITGLHIKDLKRHLASECTRRDIHGAPSDTVCHSTSSNHILPADGRTDGYIYNDISPTTSSQQINVELKLKQKTDNIENLSVETEVDKKGGEGPKSRLSKSRRRSGCTMIKQQLNSLKQQLNSFKHSFERQERINRRQGRINTNQQRVNQCLDKRLNGAEKGTKELGDTVQKAGRLIGVLYEKAFAPTSSDDTRGAAGGSDKFPVSFEAESDSYGASEP